MSNGVHEDSRHRAAVLFAWCAVACTRSPLLNQPTPSDRPDSCSRLAGPRRCFANVALGAPLTLAPRRTRFLVSGTPSMQALKTADFHADSNDERFTIVDATDGRVAPVARGLCPEPAHPQTIGLIAGNTEVICLDQVNDVVELGVLRESDGTVAWHPSVQLRHPSENGALALPIVAGLEGTIVLVFELAATKGYSAPPYAAQFAPGSADSVPLCSPTVGCIMHISRVFVTDGALHLIGSLKPEDTLAKYADFALHADGVLEVSDPLTRGRTFSGSLTEPCVVDDGQSNLLLLTPTTRHVMMPGEPERWLDGISVLPLGKGDLPYGPDVFSTVTEPAKLAEMCNRGQ